MTDRLGIIVWVYRSRYDLSKGGISSRFDRMVLHGDGIPEIFISAEDQPLVRLIKRPRIGQITNSVDGESYLYVEPFENPPPGYNYGHGGNFVYAGYADWPGVGPLPVYDKLVKARNQSR